MPGPPRANKEELTLSSATEPEIPTQVQPDPVQEEVEVAPVVVEKPVPMGLMYRPQEPVKTVFKLSAVTNGELYTEMKPLPYKVKTDLDELEMKCELCLELPCCPEHCCNVSYLKTN